MTYLKKACGPNNPLRDAHDLDLPRNVFTFSLGICKLLLEMSQYIRFQSVVVFPNVLRLGCIFFNVALESLIKDRSGWVQAVGFAKRSLAIINSNSLVMKV